MKKVKTKKVKIGHVKVEIKETVEVKRRMVRG